MTATDLLTIQPPAKRDSRGRYLLPDPEQPTVELPWTRVTTYCESIADNFALGKWQLRMAVKGLSLRPDLMALAASVSVSDRATLDRVAKEALEAAGASSGANQGTALHTFTERVDRGESPVVPAPWHDDVAAYTRALRVAGIRVVPDLIERIVVVNELRVAGTFDRLVYMPDGRLVVADLKTGRDLSHAWPKIAIQLALYANADAVWDGAGMAYEEMPTVDKETAIVMHVPAGEGKCDLYTVDIAAGWEAAQLCAQVRTWRNRKDIARPWVLPTLTDEEMLAFCQETVRLAIMDATTVRELEAAWEMGDAEGTWTDAHTELARARKRELLMGAAA